jgi:GNAT superfamily N-acetyltransferase
VPGATARLGPDDVGRLNNLYSWGGPSFYAAYQMEHGIFYGASVAGQLVAAAGTHAIAPEYGIAAVGNVYTHPDHRNRGLAKACTAAVVADLLRLGCRNVVLNVRQGNEPAVSAYTAIGFRVHCPFVEAPGRRKSYPEQVLSNLLPRRT